MEEANADDSYCNSGGGGYLVNDTGDEEGDMIELQRVQMIGLWRLWRPGSRWGREEYGRTWLRPSLDRTWA